MPPELYMNYTPYAQHMTTRETAPSLQINPSAGYSYFDRYSPMAQSGGLRQSSRAQSYLDTAANIGNAGANIVGAVSKGAEWGSKVATTLGNVASGVGIVTGLISAGMDLYNGYQQRKADQEAARQQELANQRYEMKEEERYQDAKSMNLRSLSMRQQDADRAYKRATGIDAINAQVAQEGIATSKSNRKIAKTQAQASALAMMISAMMVNANTPQSRAAIAAVGGK